MRKGVKTVATFVGIIGVSAGLGYAWIQNERATEARQTYPSWELGPDDVPKKMTGEECDFGGVPRDCQAYVFFSREFVKYYDNGSFVLIAHAPECSIVKSASQEPNLPEPQISSDDPGVLYESPFIVGSVDAAMKVVDCKQYPFVFPQPVSAAIRPSGFLCPPDAHAKPPNPGGFLCAADTGPFKAK